MDAIIKIVSSLQNAETTPEPVARISKGDTFITISTLFKDYHGHLRSDNGSMSGFWMSYIDIVEILLNLLQASQEGNWSLHLASIQAIIPWCFAYDRTNYARYLPWYLDNMLSLPNSHPEVQRQLEEGGFSV